MKHLLFSLFVALLACISASARTFVLATGISNYGDEEINLSQTTKDAKIFKEIMETQTKDVTLLTSRYANRENILSKLRAICNRAQSEDRIVFFFSGHGQKGGICVYDGVISYEELVSLLARSEAKEKICFIDACHAGSLANEVLSASENNRWTKKITEEKNQAFFVSCRSDEYSSESAWVGAGYFTQALIKGLRGKADDNHDRQITVIELFKYIHKDVTRRTKSEQHPQLIAPPDMYECVIAKWE